MENLVLLKSPLFFVFIIAIIILHTSGAVIRRIMAGKDEKAEKICNIVAIVTMVLHFVMFIGFFILRGVGEQKAVTPEEMLFVLVISSTVAITASKTSKKKGDK